MDKKIFDIYDEHFPGEENVPDKFAGPVEDQEKLDDLRKSADVLKSLSSVSIDEKYFTNILPRFRENLEKKQRSFFYKKLMKHRLASAFLCFINFCNCINILNLLFLIIANYFA